MDRFFPVNAYISDTMEHIYPDPPVKQSNVQTGISDTSSGSHQKKRKKRREMDANIRRRISLEPPECLTH
jgi:hypothetical protein